MATPHTHSSASVSSQNATPELNGALFSPMTLLLVSLGTIGGLLFAVIYLIEGITRPGYDVWQHSISLLSLGPGGWVQQVNFVVLGVFTLCSAIGWRQALAPGIGTLWYPSLRGLEGVGLIVDGFFSQDPADGYPPGAHVATVSGHATIHVLFAFLAITAIAIGECVLAWMGDLRGGNGAVHDDLHRALRSIERAYWYARKSLRAAGNRHQLALRFSGRGAIMAR